MTILYNLSIHIVSFLFRIVSLFNVKAKAFVTGRKNLLKRLQLDLGDVTSIIWIHSASLGEFEQGRPIIEKLKKQHPGHKILLTFFSPSGYEVQKNYPLADYIYYLPLDSPSNAKKFVSIVKPVVAIFIKYEFWYNYCQELKQNDIPIVSISSIFRPDQLFFKSYGEFYRRILFTFSHFFVQNDASVKLLNELNIMACTRAGDTRFDRVYQVVKDGGAIPVAEKFKGSQKLMVVGSCWEEDLDVLAPFINENYYQLKFIIAPHEITENFINTIETSLLVKSIRFSKATSLDNLEDYQVLIIDNIGMLSRLYRYGEFAFVGGAYGKGLHNILEAACYGVPIFFGNKNYEKYEEANELIMRGGAFEVSDYTDLRSKYEMINLPENFMLACDVTKFYVEENLGATDKIMNYLNTILK
jgi:3-deoxy-D-manno-octulosonic-acid transferase